MNRRLLIVFLFLANFFIGCTQVQVVKTGNPVTRNLPATNPIEISVFRSTMPPWKYEEIGVVTVNNVEKVDVIYELMRIEAAKRGANAVVGFKLLSFIYPYQNVHVHAFHNKPNRLETVELQKVFYTASGSLIHQLEEK